MPRHRLDNKKKKKIQGNRAKGRPRKRWMDNVIEDCKRRGWDIVEATRLAVDRQTILDITHTAVTACLGIALTTRRRKMVPHPSD